MGKVVEGLGEVSVGAHKLVSVVMPLFNHATYVAAAIESVLAQTYKNWELIIIDDGSTDGSANVVKIYLKKDKRIKYHYQPNQGVAMARNAGIKLARGDYVAWHDADDVAHPDRIKTQLAFLEKNKGNSGVGTWIRFIDRDGNQMQEAYRLTTQQQPAGREQTRLDIHYLFLNSDSHYGNCATFMVRKIFLDKLGGFRNLRMGEDRDMLFRLDEQQPLAMINRELYFYRQHDDTSGARMKRKSVGRMGHRLEFSLGNLAYFLSALARRFYGYDPLGTLPPAQPLARPRVFFLFWRTPRVWRYIPQILRINKMSVPEFLVRLVVAGLTPRGGKAGA
ncbi:MAG: glycosyltransferase family 2 protein [Hydrotalea sp.]|nr:glycosyltransferase family 2 protein [Hydrotalea sp.]